jgi:hypothetical protein
MICSYTCANNMYNMNEGNPITNDWTVSQSQAGHLSDENIPTDMEQNVYVRDAVMERVVESKTTEHTPTVYSMPKNSKLESVTKLESMVDVDSLRSNTARNIASIMGVPFEIIGGGYNAGDSSKKSFENSRIFITNMSTMCVHLQHILQVIPLLNMH